MAIISHGIDLVSIARVQAMLDAHGERFTKRCFTTAERAYAEAGGMQRGQRFAARFAAKEAVMKAIGTGWAQGVAWQDIEVLRDEKGVPGVRLNGRAAEIAAARGISAWHLSLSHTSELAMASVVAVNGS
jgi:holo-[acyl-carrier protein] synthase